MLREKTLFVALLLVGIGQGGPLPLKMGMGQVTDPTQKFVAIGALGSA
jgi:hypothetical protein